MNTHDEETKKFFKNTGVRCILAPRYGAEKMSWVRQKVCPVLRYLFFENLTVSCLCYSHDVRGEVNRASWGGVLDLLECDWSLQVVGTLYSHHQKIAIVDTGGPYGLRRLTSFIGGLDLTGRWDTPSHLLFPTLQKEHKNYFQNKSWEVRSLVFWSSAHYQERW